MCFFYSKRALSRAKTEVLYEKLKKRERGSKGRGRETSQRAPAWLKTALVATSHTQSSLSTSYFFINKFRWDSLSLCARSPDRKVRSKWYAGFTQKSLGCSQYPAKEQNITNSKWDDGCAQKWCCYSKYPVNEPTHSGANAYRSTNKYSIQRQEKPQKCVVPTSAKRSQTVAVRVTARLFW